MNKRPKNKKNYLNIFVTAFFILTIIIIIVKIFNYQKDQINQDDFFSILSKDIVKKITIKHKDSVLIEIKESFLKNKHKDKFNVYKKKDLKYNYYQFDIGDLIFFQKKIEDYKRLYRLNFILEFDNKPNYSILRILFDYGAFLLLIILLYLFFLKKFTSNTGNHLFNISKSKAKIFNEKNSVKITFKDVAGLKEAKEEIQEIVFFLKNPKKYTKLGGKIPKGALLIGPPGTGKTLLAKAVAGEAKVPFFSLAGPDFVEMFVGVGASRVRDLFQKAKNKAPCIIFIDEIDAIGRARGKNYMNGNSNDERENTLNQLLTEMDGFGTNMKVIVIAATNRADILDKALLRPGRFDRMIMVDLPELLERKEIFNVYLKKIKLSNNVDVDFLSKQTPGFSGADIANICNEAALIAARKNKKEVDHQDFLDSIDRIIGGLEKRSKIIEFKEKKRIAVHEIGHVVASWFLKNTSPLIRVTIVPRGRYLGAAWYLPDERQLTTGDHILDEICSLLGGRVAEQIIFGNVSTGALNDLERATKQAQSMVVFFGLNDKIGNVSYYDSTNRDEFYLSKPYSEKTAQIIDQEISKIIENQFFRAKKILTKNKDKIKILSGQLIEKEVLFRKDLEKILGNKTGE